MIAPFEDCRPSTGAAVGSTRRRISPSCSAASTETIAGRAVVVDAETFSIRSEKIRILDVDSPESDQPCIRPDGSEWRCGQQAALALANWIGARTVIRDFERRVPLIELSNNLEQALKQAAEIWRDRTGLDPAEEPPEGYAIWDSGGACKFSCRLAEDN
jgi:endonuclease YncB( thermonuclease family)